MKFRVFTPRKYLIETFAGWFVNLSAAWFITGIAAVRNIEVLTVNLVYCILGLLLGVYLNKIKDRYD